MSDYPNIVVLVLDTLRADHVGCYSYPRDTTPNIDRFAKGGTLFSNAYSPSYWTLPSHASLFTGLYPSEHGTSHRTMFLEDRHRTLAEDLKDIGYSTISISSNLFIHPEFGMTRGFDIAENPKDLPFYSTTNLRKIFKENKGKAIVSQFLRELKHSEYMGRDILNFMYSIYKRNRPSLKSEWCGRANQLFKRLKAHTDRIEDQPFFLFMNFMECHYAYSPKDEFAKRYIPDFSKEHLDIGAEHPWSRIAQPPGQDTVDTLNSLYDAELAYADAFLGMILDELEKKGLLDDTIIVVTADHGELFGEKDLFGHPPSMHNKLLHVPLIVRYPKHFPEGETIDRNVSIAGLYNGLQSILGVKFSNDSNIPSIVPVPKIGVEGPNDKMERLKKSGDRIEPEGKKEDSDEQDGDNGVEDGGSREGPKSGVGDVKDEKREDMGKSEERPIFSECLGFQANLEKYGLDQKDFDREIQALHLGERKIVHDNGAFTVFDPRSDPLEERPLDLGVEEMKELQAKFEEFRNGLKVQETVGERKEMDADIKANLEALGYL